MDKKGYNKELMEQYIELTYPLDLQGTVTEEDKMIIADTLGFAFYCLDAAAVQFKKVVSKTFEPVRKIFKRLIN